MKKEETSASPVKKAVLIVFGAVVAKQAINIAFPSKESVACKVIRDALTATKKVTEYQYDKIDPKTPLKFPEIPFDLIQECGPESFNMPFPFLFTFEENPKEKYSEEILVEKFITANKTVDYRASYPFKNPQTYFGSQVRINAEPKSAPFSQVWPCLSKGECLLYGDNSWKKKDYEKIMSKDVAKTLIETSAFGTTFVINLPKHQQTAPIHAAALKSLVTQMTNYKEWIFIDPKVAKKALPVARSGGVTSVELFTQTDEDVLKTIPHFTARTDAGQGLYFPEFWMHVVFTGPGLNIITNWRMQPNFIDTFKASPYPKMKETLFFTTAMFLKAYVLPDWVTAQADRKAATRDTWEKEMFWEKRMAVHAKNAGRAYYGDGQKVYTE